MTERIFETHTPSYGGWFEATKILETTQSDYQKIEVFETAVHGRVMLLDGLTMLTDDTHFVYHEHMVHIPAACVESLRDVLVIGGGDGGVASELVKIDEIERVVVAELDGAVVDAAQRWFPEVAAGFNDPRVSVRIGDGAAYVAEQEDAFDLIIIDSTDICAETAEATEVASPLATDAFYDSLKRAMRPGAAAIQVLGNPIFYTAGMSRLLPRLGGIWPKLEIVSMPTPFYISGDWAAGLYSVDGLLDPTRMRAPAETLKYVNAQTARGALARPNFLQRMMGER